MANSCNDFLNFLESYEQKVKENNLVNSLIYFNLEVNYKNTNLIIPFTIRLDNLMLNGNEDRVKLSELFMNIFGNYNHNLKPNTQFYLTDFIPDLSIDLGVICTYHIKKKNYVTYVNIFFTSKANNLNKVKLPITCEVYDPMFSSRRLPINSPEYQIMMYLNKVHFKLHEHNLINIQYDLLELSENTLSNPRIKVNIVTNQKGNETNRINQVKSLSNSSIKTLSLNL